MFYDLSLQTKNAAIAQKNAALDTFYDPAYKTSFSPSGAAFLQTGPKKMLPQTPAFCSASNIISLKKGVNFNLKKGKKDFVFNSRPKQKERTLTNILFQGIG